MVNLQAKTAILFGVINVGFLGAAVSITYLVLQGDVRIDAIGILSSALNVVMYASPLSAMVRNRIQINTIQLIQLQMN